jgi:tRNA uridine 5-carboxymethylaminomethyl modification enzyme
MRANEAIGLDRVDFSSVHGLSTEMVERLEAAQPSTLGAAERIRGITPAALAAILVQAKRKAA